MDFAIGHPCLYDKIKAICFEIDDKILYNAYIFFIIRQKILCRQRKINFADPSLKTKQ